MDQYLGPEKADPIDEIEFFAICLITFIGLLLSTTTCGFVVHKSFKNRHLFSSSLKIIGIANFYGLLYSLIQAINLTVGLSVFERVNDNQLDTVCYVMNPLRVFCCIQWFAWNGFILYIVHQEIKNTKYDLKSLGKFIDQQFHPCSIIICLIVAFLPFIHKDSYSGEISTQYWKYLCQYHYIHELASELIYFTINLLPMWLLVFYTIYICIDIYRTYTKLFLQLPQNFYMMMYQPLIISITWIWPTGKFFIQILNEGRSPFWIRAIFVITNGFTICFQSLIYLNQVNKFLSSREKDDSQLIYKSKNSRVRSAKDTQNAKSPYSLQQTQSQSSQNIQSLSY